LREFRVGLLIFVALVALAAGIFLVGESNNMFARKSSYFVRFESVAGLAEGNPVQLNGVTVGRVTSIDLPQEVDERLLTVSIAIDRRYSDRVRTDSEARIKTLGLLGDKYIQVSSGSADAPMIASGGEIPAAEPTDVDELITSGENAVDNFVAMSVSLRNILTRIDSGEGVLGQITSESETGSIAREKFLNILASVETLTARAERGEGSLGRLLNDDTLAIRLEEALDKLEANLALFETGEGILPALLNDAETADRLNGAVDNLSVASTELASLTRDLREGDGLLPRLLHDEELGDQVTSDLQQLLDNLNTISGRLEAGDGTAGQLINDPEIYDALQDIVVGIDESKTLRWLIRNRQKKGIEKRYEAEVEASETDDPDLR